MYSLLISLVLHQMILIPFRICVYLVHFSVRCLLSIYEASTQFFIYEQSTFLYFSQHLNCIPSSFCPLNPNWSSPSTSLIFLTILLLSNLTTIIAVCVMRLIVWWLMHFVASGFFFKAVIWLQWNPWVTFQFHVCWSVVSLFCDLLPAVWVLAEVHHHLPYPYSSSPW